MVQILSVCVQTNCPIAKGDVISLLYDQGVLIEGEGQGDPDLVEGTLIVYEFVRENYYKGFIERFNKFLKEVEEGKIKIVEKELYMD